LWSGTFRGHAGRFAADIEKSMEDTESSGNIQNDQGEVEENLEKMVADPEWKIYRSCREICDGRTRRDLLEIQEEPAIGNPEEIWNGRYEEIWRRYWNQERSVGDTGRAREIGMGNPEEIWNGRYEEIWRRYGEMQGRYKEIENGISRGDTRRSRMRNSMEIQGDLREIQRRNREIRNGRYKEIWRRYGEIQGRYREIDDGIFKVDTG
jgi:hypothetical protein